MNLPAFEVFFLLLPKQYAHSMAEDGRYFLSIFLTALLVLSSVSGAVVCSFTGWWEKWKSSSGGEAWNKLIFLLEPYGSSEIPYLQQPTKWLSSYIQ